MQSFTGVQVNRIQDGPPDGIAIVEDLSGIVIDALSYEGSIAAAVIPGIGTVPLVEGAATSAADLAASPGSLSRLPDGSDTNNAATDWTFSTTLTPGAANVP